MPGENIRLLGAGVAIFGSGRTDEHSRGSVALGAVAVSCLRLLPC